MRVGVDYTSAVRQRAGIGRYTRELVAALLSVDDVHQYTVFAATGGLESRDWRSGIDRAGVQVRALPITDDWLARLWHRLRLPIPVELLTGPLDVFYSPDFTLPPTRRGTKTILTVHDLSFVHYPDAFVPSLRRYLENAVPRSVRRADLVLADSSRTRSDLISLFEVSPEVVKVVYPGVGSRFRSEPRAGERERLRERYGVVDGPYVLGVGTLQPRKNYLYLMEGFNRLPVSLNAELQLLIAGGHGWLCDEVVAEADRRENIRILGFVEDDDLPALYRGASLFAFPSLYEGFGLPVLEAMACGAPVISSGTSSLPEVCGDAALLVDPLIPGELTEAMIRLLEDTELRDQLVTRGLARAATFTWERSARSLLDLIESLTDAR